jgi:hypothetical protein
MHLIIAPRKSRKKFIIWGSSPASNSEFRGSGGRFSTCNVDQQPLAATQTPGFVLTACFAFVSAVLEVGMIQPDGLATLQIIRCFALCLSAI